ncbi:type II secretion system protein, partial [bacterium]|nr:type II secretion system protein [bacterium]
IASTNDGGFADGRSKASPDSEKIEQTATKLQLRNFSSVEQIQDSECVTIQKNSYRNDWIASSDLRPPRNDGRLNNRNELIHDSQLTHCPLSPTLSPVGRREKKVAFTLAEVLITIGIIGVVAALTIPNLIKENQKRATITKLQKGISVINQAYKLSFDEQGEPESAFDMGAEEYFKQYWQPYIKMLQYCDTYEKCGYNSLYPYKYANNNPSPFAVVYRTARTTFYTSDALIFIVLVKSGNETTGLVVDNRIFIDINGGELPNKFGRDVFILERIEDGGGVRPYGYEKSDNEINSNCSKSSTGEFCAEKIRRAGWRIEKSYPW